MVVLKLTDGEHTFFITINELSTVQDLIDELKKRITLIRPTLLCKGEPLNPNAMISNLRFKEFQKIIFNDKYNGGA